MGVPAFVKEFCQKAEGLPVAVIAPVGSYNGIVQKAWVEGRRIKYEIKEESGRIRLAFADQCSHLAPKVTISG